MTPKRAQIRPNKPTISTLDPYISGLQKFCKGANMGGLVGGFVWPTARVHIFLERIIPSSTFILSTELLIRFDCSS